MQTNSPHYLIACSAWRLFMCLLCIAAAFACASAGSLSAETPPPAPYGPTPTGPQLAWQRRELIAFVHFNMNTFTDAEWGHGNEDPKLFNPTQLDARQWIRALKSAGITQVILTAKHHDGFCLWPSAYTEHSVKSSPWKNGQGDVVREFVDACHAQDVKPGIYLSPWDRNSALYGQGEAYNTYYVSQMKELLSGYGDMAEVWLDGANGEGPNGKKQTYDWGRIFPTIHALAPNAVVFADGSGNTLNPVHWVGNEAGIAPNTVWNNKDSSQGVPFWNPTETDVSIRPGWYYHADQDGSVKTLSALLKIYYASVGHGTVLLLNVPPDRRGLFADPDVARLKEFGEALRTIFAHDLAANKPVTATNVRGKSAAFAAANVVRGRPDTYWAADDAVTTASLEVNLGAPTAFNNIMLQEYVPLGQRIGAFTVEAYSGGVWRKIGKGTTVGYKRLLWFPTVTASKVRVNVTQALACPTLSRFGIFRGPYEAPVAPVSLLTGKIATASDIHGNQTELGADKAVDDEPETRWATNDGVRQCWLQVDAGDLVTVSRVFVSEFADRIRKFQIEYKQQEADPWLVALRGTTIGGSYSASFPRVSARYFRLNILDASDAPTVYEFQAFAPVSLLSGCLVTASNVYGNDSRYGADKAVDDDPGTRWATDDATSECWLQGDIGRVATLGRVRIAEFDPRIRRFQIEYKLKEADPWKIALAGTTGGTEYSAKFAPVEARYVRLHILEASAAPTIYEFQVNAPESNAGKQTP